MDGNYVIEAVNLTKQYGQGTVVDNLSLRVEKGEIFGFLGPNGAGKSTTLLMLLGLIRPSAGHAVINGLDPVMQARDVRRIVGYLPENVGFYADLDAIQNLTYVANLNNIPGDEARERINDLLEQVGLKADKHKKVGVFSRGMKQRLGIAEVLVKAPKILFLDEPTLGLDPDGSQGMINLIQSLNLDRGITVLLCSHNLRQVQSISRNVGIMINGKMAAEGSIESLAKEKFGVGEREFSLEELYMKYFKEA